MLQKNEERCSNKILTFVQPADMGKWSVMVKRIIKKIKRDPTEDFDTEYVDIDTLLNMYMEQFRIFKRMMQKRLRTQFNRVVPQALGAEEPTEVSVDNVSSIMSNVA